MSRSVEGQLAEFRDAGALKDAVRQARQAGFLHCEAFTPYPVEGLEEALHAPRSPIPAIMLGAAAVGAAGGFVLQWYAARDFPLDIGGRPLFSWPAFIPVTFELGVLTAVLVGVAVFFWLAGLPRYDHPAFSAAAFARASSDRFFLWLPASDPKYSGAAVHALLARLHPESVTEVPA